MTGLSVCLTNEIQRLIKQMLMFDPIHSQQVQVRVINTLNHMVVNMTAINLKRLPEALQTV